LRSKQARLVVCVSGTNLKVVICEDGYYAPAASYAGLLNSRMDQVPTVVQSVSFE